MNTIIDRLKAAGLNPRAKVLPNGNGRITLFASNDNHPKQEQVTIDVDASGSKVVSSSKYAYLLPESVGDDIRLA